jgi:hypothetical protein
LPNLRIVILKDGERGDGAICDSPFSYTDREKRVRADHPPRVIREIINIQALIDALVLRPDRARA